MGYHAQSLVAVSPASDFSRQAARSSNALQCDAIIVFYCIYYGVIFIGKLAGLQTTYVGAVIFLFLLYGKYWRYLGAIRINMLVLLILFAMLAPLVPLISYTRQDLMAVYPQLIKYYALHFVILVGISLPLAPFCKSKNWWILYVVLLTFLVTGWISPEGVQYNRWGGQARIRGFLTNANNFALTAMSLYCLVDPEKIKAPVRWINHIIVLLMVYFSRTAGALVSYFIATGYRLLLGRNGRMAAFRAVSLTTVCLMSACVVYLIPPEVMGSFGSPVKKIEVVRENATKVLSGKKIDYYSIIMKERQDVTSGIWRLEHWGEMIRNVRCSSPDKQLFGFGIGSSMTNLGILPHNDYLRIFYETGLVGLFLNMAIWTVLYRRMDKKYRWVSVAIAVFCMTENNYDHFPAMSLLAFYMIGAGTRNRGMILRTRFA